MDKNLKVTVGIPFYNAERYLAFAIQSIINQTFRDWELILVDDGSNDNSLQIAGSFNNPRIRIIHDSINRGISFRLNQIISEAKGQFIARMDADDISFTDRFQEQFSMFENNPQLDIVDSEAVIINNENNILGLRSISQDHKNICQTFQSPRFIHPTVMYRKSFIEKFMYDSAFDGAEDIDLWIRSLEIARVGRISYPLYFYRESDKLNIKTYLFRCSQLEKLWRSHRKKISQSFLYYLILKVRIKGLIYSVLHFMNVESVLLKQRNSDLMPGVISDYSGKLDDSISSIPL